MDGERISFACVVCGAELPPYMFVVSGASRVWSACVEHESPVNDAVNEYARGHGFMEYARMTVNDQDGDVDSIIYEVE